MLKDLSSQQMLNPTLIWAPFKFFGLVSGVGDKVKLVSGVEVKIKLVSQVIVRNKDSPSF